MIPLAAFGLILLSACMHASWNVVIRHLKGNTPVLALAHCAGSLLLIPFALMTPDLNLTEMFYNPSFWPLMTVSAGAMSMYSLLIAAAYVIGDVGLVYPLARGTSIILATFASQYLHIDEKLQFSEYCAILAIIAGIAGLCYESLTRKAVPTDSVGGYARVPSNANDLEAEMSAHLENPGSPRARKISIGNFQEYSADASERSRSSPTATDQQQRRRPTVAIDNVDEASSTPNNLVITTSKQGKDQDLFKGICPDIGLGFAQNKVTLSMLMALCVGTCTGSYSIADSMSVKIFPMVPWYCISSILSSMILLVYILIYHYGQTVEALMNQKMNILMMAPPVIGAYMIILYVFTFPGVSVALVVSVREFSVVIGSVLGVVFLKEPFSVGKFAAIGLMMIGMVMVKML